MLADPLSSDLCRLLVEGAPDMLSHHQPDGQYLYASPSSADLTGYHPQELTSNRLYDFVHVNDVEKIRKAWSQTRLHNTEQSVEYRFRHKGGYYVWLKTTYKPLGTGRDTPMIAYSQNIQDAKDLEAALQILADQEQLLAAEDWFLILVSHLTTALKVSFAFITELNDAGDHVRMLAFWKGNNFAEPYTYPLHDTPCDDVIHKGRVCYYALGVQGRFPNDADLVALNAQGYLGLPVFSIDRRIIGHVAILHDKPLKLTDAHMWLAKLFATRAGIELERYQRQPHEVN